MSCPQDNIFVETAFLSAAYHNLQRLCQGHIAFLGLLRADVIT